MMRQCKNPVAHQWRILSAPLVDFPYRVNPAAHLRATAPLPVAQAQQAGLTHSGEITRLAQLPQRRNIHTFGGKYLMANKGSVVIYETACGQHMVMYWDAHEDSGVTVGTFKTRKGAETAATEYAAGKDAEVRL